MSTPVDPEEGEFRADCELAKDAWAKHYPLDKLSKNFIAPLIVDGYDINGTHSPILMAYPNAQIFLLGGDTIRAVSYTETEHFTVTRDFLNNHQRMLQALLDDVDHPPRDDE